MLIFVSPFDFFPQSNISLLSCSLDAALTPLEGAYHQGPASLSLPTHQPHNNNNSSNINFAQHHQQQQPTHIPVSPMHHHHHHHSMVPFSLSHSVPPPVSSLGGGGGGSVGQTHPHVMNEGATIFGGPNHAFLMPAHSLMFPPPQHMHLGPPDATLVSTQNSIVDSQCMRMNMLIPAL